MGMDPIEIGERVLNGILNDDLYILTHPDHQEEVVRDFEELIEAFPDELGDPARIAFEEFRQKTKYDIKEEYASRKK